MEGKAQLAFREHGNSRQPIPQTHYKEMDGNTQGAMRAGALPESSTRGGLPELSKGEEAECCSGPLTWPASCGSTVSSLPTHGKI
jgi:hypothetical protein